jgi:hypothetical protein
MHPTHGHPFDTGLARRLGNDRAARRARRRRAAGAALWPESAHPRERVRDVARPV